MTAVVLWSWVGALVVGAVVLTFALYEVGWRARRIRRDLARLQEIGGGLAGLQTQLRQARSSIDTITSARNSP